MARARLLLSELFCGGVVSLMSHSSACGSVFLLLSSNSNRILIRSDPIADRHAFDFATVDTRVERVKYRIPLSRLFRSTASRVDPDREYQSNQTRNNYAVRGRPADFRAEAGTRNAGNCLRCSLIKSGRTVIVRRSCRPADLALMLKRTPCTCRAFRK